MTTSNTKIEIKQKVIKLANSIRSEILFNGFTLDNLDSIANFYGVDLSWKSFDFNADGCYIKIPRSIILNQDVNYHPRVIFSFFHELMHDIIEHNDEILEIIHNSTIKVDDLMDIWIEDFCNIGASEILMPSDEVRKMISLQGFSPSVIPLLCQNFIASSVAVAFQMLNSASHNCYLVIAELSDKAITPPKEYDKLIDVAQINLTRKKLIIIYSGGSSSAKYTIPRFNIIDSNHLLYSVPQTTGVLRGEDKIPFKNPTNWVVPIEAIYFQNRIFAFFNVKRPQSNLQLSLF